MRRSVMSPRFVDFIRRELEEGVLYVSRRFSTASHLCCCGCKSKIVTPLREKEYEIVERGDLVSLFPSIGNWSHPCKSHYWIRDNKVIWAGWMNESAIRRGREFDDAERDAYFAEVAWPWWRIAWSNFKRNVGRLFD